MKKIIVVVLCVLVLSSCNQTSKPGFFSKMPSSYDVDSLEVFSEVFKDLQTEVTQNGQKLKIDAADCSLIPFCGYLFHKNDSIYFSPEDKDYKLFFNLHAKKFSSRIMNYDSDRADKITALGLIKDQVNGDSVFLFRLDPVKQLAPSDDTRLKYITISQGGFRQFTFGGTAFDYTIELREKPFLVKKIVHTEQ
jgi:hypothetical protein